MDILLRKLKNYFQKLYLKIGMDIRIYSMIFWYLLVLQHFKKIKKELPFYKINYNQ